MPTLNNKPEKARHKSKQHGFAMLEVLVTAIIFAIGISGMGMLLLKTIQGTQDNAQLSQGMWIVQDFIGRIRANPEGAKNKRYEVSATPDCETQPQYMCAEHMISAEEEAGVHCVVDPTNNDGERMARYDIWITTCGFDDPTSTTNKIFDTPAEFLVNPVLTSTCDLTVGEECLQYTVNLSWNSKIAKGAKEADDRTTLIEYSMVVELN